MLPVPRTVPRGSAPCPRRVAAQSPRATAGATTLLAFSVCVCRRCGPAPAAGRRLPGGADGRPRPAAAAAARSGLGRCARSGQWPDPRGGVEADRGAARGGRGDRARVPGRGYALSQPLALLDAGRDRRRAAGRRLRARDWPRSTWPGASTPPISELLRRPPRRRACACCWPSARPAGAAGAGASGRRRWPPTSTCRCRARFGGGLARLGGLSLVAGVAAVEALHGPGFRRGPTEVAERPGRGRPGRAGRTAQTGRAAGRGRRRARAARRARWSGSASTCACPPRRPRRSTSRGATSPGSGRRRAVAQRASSPPLLRPWLPALDAVRRRQAWRRSCRATRALDALAGRDRCSVRGATRHGRRRRAGPGRRRRAARAHARRRRAQLPCRRSQRAPQAGRRHDRLVVRPRQQPPQVRAAAGRRPRRRPVVAIDHRRADLAAGWRRVLPARIDVAHAGQRGMPSRCACSCCEALVARCARMSLARTQRAIRRRAHRLCAAGASRASTASSRCWARTRRGRAPRWCAASAPR